MGNVTAFYSIALTLLTSDNAHSCLEIPQLWLPLSVQLGQSIATAVSTPKETKSTLNLFPEERGKTPWLSACHKCRGITCTTWLCQENINWFCPVLQDTSSHAAALIHLWSQLISLDPIKAHSGPIMGYFPLVRHLRLSHSLTMHGTKYSAPHWFLPILSLPECLRQTVPSTAMWLTHHHPTAPLLFLHYAYGRPVLPTHLAAAQALPFHTRNPLSHSPFQPWAETSSSFTLWQTSPEKSSVILREGRNIKNELYCIQ